MSYETDKQLKLSIKVDTKVIKFRHTLHHEQQFRARW